MNPSIDFQINSDEVDVDINAQGELYHYFSNALDHPEQLKLQEWAHRMVAANGEEEVSVSIAMNIPVAVETLLSVDYGHKNSAGGYTVDARHKASFEALKEQLLTAVSLLKKAQYEDFT